MNKIIGGLIFLVLGIWATSSWWWFIWDVVKGLFAIVLLLVGLALLGVGVKNISESAELQHAAGGNKDDE
jgi:hypothetical protein